MIIRFLDLSTLAKLSFLGIAIKQVLNELSSFQSHSFI